MKKFIPLCLTILLTLPSPVLAQTSEPGQDPFALSQELLQFFGAAPSTSTKNSTTSDPNTQSLFNGDNMKNTGLFTTPSTQLGGASPLTNPIRTNQEDMGPTNILVTSQFEPSGDLKGSTVIKLTVTLKNVGTTTAKNLTFSAKLEDSNATLLTKEEEAETVTTTTTTSGTTTTETNTTSTISTTTIALYTKLAELLQTNSTQISTNIRNRLTQSFVTDTPAEVGLDHPVSAATPAQVIAKFKTLTQDTNPSNPNYNPDNSAYNTAVTSLTTSLTQASLGSDAVTAFAQLKTILDNSSTNAQAITQLTQAVNQASTTNTNTTTTPGTTTSETKVVGLIPQPPDPPFNEDLSDLNDPAKGLVWDKLKNGQPITLAANKDTQITWYFKANKDDTILRWTLEAQYGAGASTLLQWIPIKNPNPTGNANSTSPTLSNTCSNTGTSEAFPDSASFADINAKFKTKWNISLVTGAADWSEDRFRPLVKLYWETLSSVECTPFITMTTGQQSLNIEAGGDTYLWGDFLNPPNLRLHINTILPYVTSAPEKVQQNLIHELGHVLRGRNSAIYEQFPDGSSSSICGKGSPNPYVSGYGATNCSENLSEILGYYAIRASHEWGMGTPYCPAKNPFDWGQQTYYDWAKTTVFGGKEFGSPPPANGTC